jgi:hypothetical protein
VQIAKCVGGHVLCVALVLVVVPRSDKMRFER